MRLLRLGLAALASMGTSFPAAPAVQGQPDIALRGMAVSPVIFRVAVKPGANTPLGLRIENFEPRALRIRLSLHSVRFADGSYDPALDAANPADCSSWFAALPSEIDARPRGVTEIPLRFQAPRAKAGVYYCLAVMDPAVAPDSRSIRPEYLIPIVLFLGPQARPDLRFGTPVLGGTPERPVLQAPIENDGDAFTVVGADVTLRNARTGAIVASASDSDRNLYPHSKRNLEFPLRALPAGEYVASYRGQAATRTFSPLESRFVVNGGKISAATPAAVVGLPPVVADPHYLRLAVPPGGTRYATVKISNESAQKVALQVEVHGLHQSPNGAFAADSAAPARPLRISALPQAFTVFPRRTETIRLAAAMDPKATGEEWFCVSIRPASGGTMSEDVYGTVSTPGAGHPKLDLRLLGVEEDNGAPSGIRFQMANTGDLSLAPFAAATVLEQGVTAVENLDVPKVGDGGILPGSAVTNRLPLPPNLKPGAYVVAISYQYGDHLSARLNVPVVVKPRKGGSR